MQRKYAEQGERGTEELASRVFGLPAPSMTKHCSANMLSRVRGEQASRVFGLPTPSMTKQCSAKMLKGVRGVRGEKASRTYLGRMEVQGQSCVE